MQLKRTLKKVTHIMHSLKIFPWVFIFTSCHHWMQQQILTKGFNYQIVTIQLIKDDL